jgi:hypothetical protein
MLFHYNPGNSSKDSFLKESAKLQRVFGGFKMLSDEGKNLGRHWGSGVISELFGGRSTDEVKSIAQAKAQIREADSAKNELIRQRSIQEATEALEKAKNASNSSLGRKALLLGGGVGLSSGVGFLGYAKGKETSKEDMRQLAERYYRAGMLEGSRVSQGNTYYG